MFLKKFGDLAAGVFFLILSIALFLAASALPPSLMGGLGSDFMPKVLAIITCILSFFQIRAGFRTMRSFQPNEGAEEEKPEYLRVLATIAADERRHAKRLSTAYFLISGVRYWPVDRVPNPSPAPFSAALRELEVFLNGCGIQVNTWIPSAPLSSLVHAPAAELNLVKRVRWARRMREKFGTAYLHIGGAGRYAGLDGICTFYRDIGQALRMEAAVEPVVLAARAQALEETAEARRRLGQARAVLVSRSIQQAPFELKSYVRDYGLSVSHLCVILTPESRKNLNVTPALEDSLLARVREAAALYSPETQLLLNPAEETLRGIFAEADVVVGTGDFTLEGMGAPLIPAVNETTSLSFPSYVRTVRRMCRRLEHGTERSSLLLGKMPFQSRHYPLYCNQSNLAAKEMWSRMWLNRKGDSV